MQEIITRSLCTDGARFRRKLKEPSRFLQLRNLVWANSKHDIYVMHHYAINHWSPLRRKVTPVMNLSGQVGNLASRSDYILILVLGSEEACTLDPSFGLLICTSTHSYGCIVPNLEELLSGCVGKVTVDIKPEEILLRIRTMKTCIQQAQLWNCPTSC
jgi:hypothetical protein